MPYALPDQQARTLVASLDRQSMFRHRWSGAEKEMPWWDENGWMILEITALSDRGKDDDHGSSGVSAVLTRLHDMIEGQPPPRMMDNSGSNLYHSFESDRVINIESAVTFF